MMVIPLSARAQTTAVEAVVPHAAAGAVEAMAHPERPVAVVAPRALVAAPMARQTLLLFTSAVVGAVATVPPVGTGAEP